LLHIEQFFIGGMAFKLPGVVIVGPEIDLNAGVFVGGVKGLGMMGLP